MKHIQSLDALRGLAVLAVMAFHAFYFPFGWVGVQLFFVLSGFLITGILLRVKDNHTGLKAFLSRFFWRRTLRIWPLYFLYLGFFALMIGIFPQWIGFSPTTAQKAFNPSPLWFCNQPWPYLLTFTLNFYPHAHGAAGHLWTLAIEEQFYVVWPFLVYFLKLRTLRRLLVGLLLCGPLIRLGVGLYYFHIVRDDARSAAAIYGLTASHFDAFASGALLCVLPQFLHQWWKHRAGLVLSLQLGLTAIAGLSIAIAARARGFNSVMTLGYDIGLPIFGQYVWGYTLLNLSSAALVFYLVNAARVPRLFENRVLVYLGKISYGMYIWHVAVLYAMWHVWPDWTVHRAAPKSLLLLATYVALVVAIASLSYYGFEQFFLRLKDRVAPDHKTKVALAEA